ncbi:sensor histidine kinase [Bacteroidota bacterium]
MDSQINKQLDSTDEELVEEINSLSNNIQSLVNKEISRIDFLSKISRMILNSSKCDSFELWLKENSNYVHCSTTQTTEQSFHYEIIPTKKNENEEIVFSQNEKSILNDIRLRIINRNFNLSLPLFTPHGSFWTNDTSKSTEVLFNSEERKSQSNFTIIPNNISLILIPLLIRDKVIGLLQLISNKKNYFTERIIELLEGFTQVLGPALITQNTQAALHERLKELSCLYHIVQVSEKSGITKDEILDSIIKLLPPAWQYPEITVGRIVFDGKIYSTSKFHRGWQKQTSDIVVKDIKRGIIEVIYTKVKPQLEEGPFLREERHLINAIARQVALILEKKEAEEEKFAVQEQLRHADRLATLGQLVAGVAHELNEPLASILGFSQLIYKNPDLPEGVKDDANKILKSTLYSRDVIKKLLLFAREIQPKIEKVNLNELIKEGLFLFEARCAKAGIDLILNLSKDNPEILGEKSQINQVLVNLVVNSMQAMPNGGNLIIETHILDKLISLVVKDTGVGMTEEVKRKLFLPFFTTKDVNEGTGLGLSVVHGIISSHNGTIKFESKLGSGTRFEIHLPSYIS